MAWRSVWNLEIWPQSHPGLILYTFFFLLYTFFPMLKEETINAVTHGAGAALGAGGLAVLVVLAALRGDAWHVASCAIYGATLVLLFTSSTLYHSFRAPRVKHVFRVIDHASIYLLIAGTYTPFLLVSLRGSWGWSLFAVVWGLALAGIAFQIFFVDRFRLAQTLIYLGMGWLAVVATRPLLARVPAGGLVWLLAGGLFYTLGAVFYLWKKLPYHHGIWHLFVLAGSVCHYFAILLYVIP